MSRKNRKKDKPPFRPGFINGRYAGRNASLSEGPGRGPLLPGEDRTIEGGHVSMLPGPGLDHHTPPGYAVIPTTLDGGDEPNGVVREVRPARYVTHRAFLEASASGPRSTCEGELVHHGLYPDEQIIDGSIVNRPVTLWICRGCGNVISARVAAIQNDYHRSQS